MEQSLFFTVIARCEVLGTSTLNRALFRGHQTGERCWSRVKQSSVFSRTGLENVAGADLRICSILHRTLGVLREELYRVVQSMEASCSCHAYYSCVCLCFLLFIHSCICWSIHDYFGIHIVTQAYILFLHFVLQVVLLIPSHGQQYTRVTFTFPQLWYSYQIHNC